MKYFQPTLSFLLLEIGSASAHVIPQERRDVPNIGQYTMRGNVSAIASWAYTALAYGTIEASNSTIELTNLCNISVNISTRYLSAFPEASGDITKFARDAICSAAKAANPSPEPNSGEEGNSWWMKSYLAAMFTVQSYYGDLRNSTYAANLCWYVESSLLEGLWIPTPDQKHSLVDAEGSFCATAGYYGKDEFFMYTNATQPADIIAKVDVLVSKMMARILQVVLKSEDEISYICDNFGRWKSRVDRLGIFSNVLEKEICGGERKVKELDDATMALLSAMTDLYITQLLHAGNAPDYPQWLCNTLRKDGLNKVGLDGVRVVGDSCKSAKGVMG